MSILSEIMDSKCELEMTPMIDVTFLLLIFFLCTIKFKTLEGKLAAYLPMGAGVNPHPEETNPALEIVIEIVEEGFKVDPRDPSKPWSGQGRYAWRDRKLRYGINSFSTLDIGALGERMVELHRLDAEREITIDARTGILYGDVVGVLDAVVQARFPSITFVGSYED